jgi:D-arabinose 5-phosphate isomerase GutQ
VHDAALADDQDKETKRANRKNLLKTAKNVNTLAETRALLIALVEQLGLDK